MQMEVEADSKRSEASISDQKFQSVLWVGMIFSMMGTIMLAGWGSLQVVRMLAFIICMAGNGVWLWNAVRAQSIQMILLNSVLIVSNFFGTVDNVAH